MPFAVQNVVELYTSYRGRISQETFWKGFLGIALPYAAISGVANAYFFYQSPLSDPDFMREVFAAAASETPPDELIPGMMEFFRALSLVNGTLIALAFVPSTALIVKRRHDRGSRGIVAWIYMGLLLFVTLAAPMWMPSTLDAPVAPGWLILSWAAAFLAMFGIGIYLLIVLGILEGTNGPNRYGPDPRPYSRAAPLEPSATNRRLGGQ
jgi:uncharacterized membrane protein YhaH (DUF805 family)